MNERIKELVKQAGGHFSTHTLTSYPAQRRESIELWDKNIEKFAELIIKECISKCDGNSEYKNHTDTEFGQGFAAGIKIAKAQIQIHFGVEE